MTLQRQVFLKEFLARHPGLKEYREMTLQVGELSRLPPAEIDGHQIDSLQPSKKYTKKLNTAIRTLKNHRDSLLRFVAYASLHPGFTNAQHANMEHYNTAFKKPFRAGNNLLKKDRILGRLNTQFSGRIEWYLEEPMLI